MLEHSSEPLPPRWKFLLRLVRSFLAGIAIIAGSLFVGMAGYRYFDSPLSWVDAFLNASMLLSGMGPVGTPKTDAGKLFAGAYALYSGFVVIVASGIVLAPVLHRVLHRFHLASHHRKKTNGAAPVPQETPS